MEVTWFATFENPSVSSLPDAALERVAQVIRNTEGLSRGLIHTPWPVDGLPFDDGPAPFLQLQLYAPALVVLERALDHAGSLRALADPAWLPVPACTRITEQAMLVRPVTVSGAWQQKEDVCSFMVHYPGRADDPNAWLGHYMAHHTPIMRRFPAVREVEVCSPLMWLSKMPWYRADHMQRNKVVFDDASGLRAALSSDVMSDMRMDTARLPPFSGGSVHHAMRTRLVKGLTV